MIINYKLEKDLFITEINKIANNYIGIMENKIKELNIMFNMIKNEQNTIIEKNKKIKEYFNLFNKNNIGNKNNPEEFLIANELDKIGETNNTDYSQYIQNYKNNNNYFKFNYFTSQIISDISINNNSNNIMFSKIYFDSNTLINFVNDLKRNNKINYIDNNDNNNTYLKNIVFDEKTMNNDTFAIKNVDNKALIQVNLYLNKNNESINDNNIYYGNISCYLLISNKDMNNYCQLTKKIISDGNLCLYEFTEWKNFNIFNYKNLSFQVVLFNHYK